MPSFSRINHQSCLLLFHQPSKVFVIFARQIVLCPPSPFPFLQMISARRWSYAIAYPPRAYPISADDRKECPTSTSQLTITQIATCWRNETSNRHAARCRVTRVSPFIFDRREFSGNCELEINPAIARNTYEAECVIGHERRMKNRCIR